MYGMRCRATPTSATCHGFSKHRLDFQAGNGIDGGMQYTQNNVLALMLTLLPTDHPLNYDQVRDAIAEIQTIQHEEDWSATVADDKHGDDNTGLRDDSESGDQQKVCQGPACRRPLLTVPVLCAYTSTRGPRTPSPTRDCWSIRFGYMTIRDQACLCRTFTNLE